MSIASRIQEIETHIGDVYDTINYSYDTTGVNKNIINIPKYLKKGYIDIINNGIDTLYNNFPKVSGIGSNLSLTPTYEAPMKLNEIQGDTLQENTPTPDTPVEIQSVTGLQNIEVCGKNLWSVGDKTDVGWASNYVDIKNLLNSLKEGTYSITLNFKVTEIVKEKTNNQYGFAFYNSNGVITNKKNTNNNINVNDIFTCVYTFTISKSQVGNFTHAYFYGFGNDTDNVTARSLMYDCQLELGPTATDYEEYKGNTYEVSLGNIELNKISTYEDRIYKDNGKWYLEKNIGKVVLTGNNEGWVLTATYTNNVRFNSIINLGTTTQLISNYFLEGKGGTDTTNIDTNGNSGVLMITIPKSIASTLSQFTTWLSTHNTEVLYVLNTPTDTQITDTELIEDLEILYTAKSQEGTTNISITSEDLEMILNVSALKGEV